MKGEADPQSRALEIASRQDLALALRAPDAAVRSAVLQSINKMIDQALATGKQPNQEVLDELYLRYQELEGCSDRTWYTFLLLRLDGPQSLEIARQEFMTTDNDKILLLAAAKVSQLPAEERVALLGPCVSESNNAMRCRAAANMLDDCIELLSPSVALRAAIISDHNLPLPPLTADTLEAWLTELDGPYPRSAREALVQQGNEALEAMLGLWERLPADVRIWLLRTGVKRNVSGILPVLRQTSKHKQSTELLRVSLECLKALHIEDEDLVAPLYSHSIASIRAAAIAAGSARVDWSIELYAETEDEVRLAIIERIGRCGGADDVSHLVPLMKAKNWRIRARVTDAMVALAPASLSSLREALGDSDEHMRVAAAQGLYRLGKQEWVRQDLSCAGQTL